MMREKRIKLIIIPLALFCICSCEQKQKQHPADDNGYNQADSRVSDLGDRHEWQDMLVACDSLEKTGELSKVKGIFYRTIAHNLTGNYRTSLSLYYQLGDIDVKSLKTKADIDSYTYACKDYVRLLCDMRRYDRALRQAYTANRKLKAAGQPAFVDHHDIAQMIGECLLCLGRKDEAKRYFQKSLEGMRTRLVNNHEPLDLRECQKTMNAIATVYMRCNQFDEAAPWIAREDSLYAQALAQSSHGTEYIDEMKAEISYCRAMHAHATGNTAEAEKAFTDYQSTQASKLPANIINSCRYLMATKRYEEASRNYTQLDKFMTLRTSGASCCRSSM